MAVFFDRPSAAFINTVFSNYPLLREQEVTFPGSNVPLTSPGRSRIRTSHSTSTCPIASCAPRGANGTYQIRDNTNVTRGADGTLNPIDPATGLANPGQHRRDIRVSRRRPQPADALCPAVESRRDSMKSPRTCWSRFDTSARKAPSCLQATSFAQGFDLNDPNAPDFIFERFNQAYVAAGSPNGRAQCRRDGAGSEDLAKLSVFRTRRSAE